MNFSVESQNFLCGVKNISLQIHHKDRLEKKRRQKLEKEGTTKALKAPGHADMLAHDFPFSVKSSGEA